MQPTNSLFFITIAPFQMVMKAFAKNGHPKTPWGRYFVCNYLMNVWALQAIFSVPCRDVRGSGFLLRFLLSITKAEW